MNNEVKKDMGKMCDRCNTVINRRAITLRNFVSQEKCDDDVSDSGLGKVIKMARKCCDDIERRGDYVVATDTMRAYLDLIEDESGVNVDHSILKKFIISLIRGHYEPDEATVEKYGVDMFKYTCDEISKWFDEHGDSQLASYVRVLDGDDKNTFVPM